MPVISRAPTRLKKNHPLRLCVLAALALLPRLVPADAGGTSGRRPALWTKALRAATPALLLAALLLLPFVGKAFTIDDTVFMHQASYALGDPLHPSALTMVWSEVPRPMRLSQVMPTGPLMAGPIIGQHTDYVLRELLGLGEEEIIEKAVAGVLA